MNPLEKAIAIAVEAHKGQTDKSGLPYILHPLRIMMKMPDEATRIVAVLHDVVEDTDCTLADLRSAGFSEEIVAAVDRMTHRASDSYEAYIHKIADNAIARKVKIGDLEDNMNVRRLPDIRDKDLERIRKYHKYHLMLSQLENDK